MRPFPPFSAIAALVTLASCANEAPPTSPTPSGRARPGVSEVEPEALSFAPAAGQTLYVPAYSSIYSSDEPREFRLAITLSVRNVDRREPLFVESVRYYDHDGRLVRDYLKKPLRIAPLASAEFFVGESDRSGGYSACFLVDWVAERAIGAPVVESVMIGTASTQGVSFTCTSRVLSDRPRPVPTGSQPPEDDRDATP